METKNFMTKIKGRHKLSSEYARARIANIALMTTGDYLISRLISAERLKKGKRVAERGDLVIIHTCTTDEYDKFRKDVEVLYPGLCIFDI